MTPPIQRSSQGKWSGSMSVAILTHSRDSVNSSHWLFSNLLALNYITWIKNISLWENIENNSKLSETWYLPHNYNPTHRDTCAGTHTCKCTETGGSRVRFKRGILETVLLAWLWTWGTCCMWRELWLPQRLSPHSSPGRSHNVDLSSLPFFQVVLPLIDQYFKNHRLYFLSAASRPLCSGGHAANKEKEMVTR